MKPRRVTTEQAVPPRQGCHVYSLRWENSAALRQECHVYSQHNEVLAIRHCTPDGVRGP